MKKVFKLWWGWNPGKIEKHLETMAAYGWRLVTVEFAQMLFGFVKDEPTKTSYCVDYNSNPSEEYLTILSDDGWGLVNKYSGWIIWRKDYQSERPKIYTDNQSLIDRNKRVLLILIIATLLQIPLLTMIFIDIGYSEHLALAIMIFAIYIPLIMLMLFGIIKIIIANRILKNEKR